MPMGCRGYIVDDVSLGMKEWHEERALHLAIKSRDAAVVRLLLEKGVPLGNPGLVGIDGAAPGLAP
jgi:hypothetical protein